MFAFVAGSGVPVQMTALILWGLVIAGVVWLVRTITKIADSITRMAQTLDEVKRELEKKNEKQ